MILIIGIPSEPPVEMVIAAAENLNLPHVVFNQRQAHTFGLSIQVINNMYQGILLINGVEYPLSEFNGAYTRMIEYNFLPELDPTNIFNYIGPQDAYRSAAVHNYLAGWLETASCRVLNRPSDTLSNLSKPYQAQIISKVGFKIPPTCITNQIAFVKNFKTTHPNLIYKSTSSARSIVRELKPHDMKQLEKLRYLPTQFQKKLQGVNIRVHVVGDALFATKAISDIVDYRYAARENEATTLVEETLPPETEEQCFALAKLLNLPLCGIDLFKEDNGDYYCFEVNPSPGFSYYQSTTGQEISGAIVKWLELGTSK